MLGSSTQVCVERASGRRVAGRSLGPVGNAIDYVIVRLRLSEGHCLKMGKVEEEGVQRLPGIHTLCTCTQVCLCLSHYITHAYMQACTHFRNLFSKSNTICMVNCCHVSTEQSGKALIEFKRVMFWNTEGLMKELKLHYDQEQFYTPS